MEENKTKSYSFGKMEVLFLFSESIVCLLYLFCCEYPTGVSP